MSDAPLSGRVIHGFFVGDGSALGRPEPAFWNDETEARYMDQVRERAQQKAREILSQAMTEAAQLREQARAEGFHAGREEALGLVQQEAQRVASFLGGVDQALHVEKERVAAEHKTALYQLLRAAFEKTLGVLLDADRDRILRTLFDEAMLQLQASGAVTLHVSPADLALATDLAAEARTTTPNMPELRVVASPELAPGGVRLECGTGLVDNSITSRFAQVQAILDSYQDGS